MVLPFVESADLKNMFAVQFPVKSVELQAHLFDQVILHRQLRCIIWIIITDLTPHIISGMVLYNEVLHVTRVFYSNYGQLMFDSQIVT